MAGIDKIYVDNYNDYISFINYCKTIQEDIQKLFNINIFDCFYFTELTEQSFEIEDNVYPITNFPHKIDYYLIKNCNIPFIIDRLKDQYGDSYNEIKNDSEILNDYTFEKFKKFKIIRGKSRYPYVIKKQKRRFIISIEDLNIHDTWVYDKTISQWKNTDKSNNLNNNNCSCDLIFGKSYKALIRKINSWNLPKGLEIRIVGSYYSSCFKIITK